MGVRRHRHRHRGEPGPDGPSSIESAYEDYVSVPGSMRLAAAAEPEGYGAIIPGCFGDPGLDGFREILSIPIVGPCEASMHLAAQLGHAFGIVTVLDSVVEPMRKLARFAGLDTRVAAVLACDIPVLELHDDSYDAVREACEEAPAAGADTLVLGCMSMAFLGVAERLSEELGVLVLNPARVAFEDGGSADERRISHSKRAYPVPPKIAAGTAALL